MNEPFLCGRTIALCMGIALLSALLAADAASAQAPPAAPAVTFDGRQHPTIRIGEAVALEFRAGLQMDWRDYGEDGIESDPFDVHRARIALDGTLFRRVDWQLERELSETSRPWRDAFVNVRLHRAIEIRGGRFKMPFSMEQLSGSMDLDFVYRSLAATYFAPGRDLGVMAHGSLFGNRMRYQAGGFRRGGENIRDAERSDPQSARTYAARATVRPWNRRGSSSVLDTLLFGGAYTWGDLPEGLNSVRGRTIADTGLFYPVYVNGSRRRAGLELEWRPGPVSLRGELIRVADERRGESVDDGDLPDAVARGWYVAGAWRFARLPHGGSLEAAARIDDIETGGGSALASTSPRAEFIEGRSDRIWTFGVNWKLNRFAKVLADTIREQQQALPGTTRTQVWSEVLRIQIGL